MKTHEKVAAQQIGRIIRETRKKKNKTQIDVAKQMKVSQSALSKMENGLLIPSAYEWLAFCQWMKVKSDAFLRGKKR